MKQFIKKYFFTSFLLILPLFGDQSNVRSPTVQEFYSATTSAFQEKRWDDVLYVSKYITTNYPSSPFAKESLYYQAVAHYNLNHLSIANKKFSEYLKKELSPKFLDETFNYKFSIAEKFRNGAKKNLFGWKKMPKIVPAASDAVKIYDEIINALPNSEIAAQSLFGKGKILVNDEEYNLALESFQQLIRCFPKHSLASKSFIAIGKVYLKQCNPKQQNLDLLDLANLNLQKFERAFPRDEGVEIAKNDISHMKEIYAQSFFDVGDFYERTKKIGAAKVYYSKVISAFPDTAFAKTSQERLDKISKE